MTLIARVVIGGQRLYFGDLLLSSEVGPNTVRPQIDLPIFSNVNSKLPKNARRFIAGARQKLNVLNDRFVLAWAGSQVQASAAARELTELSAARPLCSQTFAEYISSLSPQDINDLSIIGTTLRPDPTNQGRYISEDFDFGAETFKIGDDTLTAAGTGTSAFLHAAQQALNRPGRPQDPALLFHWARQTGVSIASQLIGGEMATGSNLVEWWGCGIETAYINDHWAFEKHDNTLNILLRVIDGNKVAREIAGDALELIPLYVKYDYVHDVLVIQSLYVKFTSYTTHRIVNFKRHAYLPLLKSRKDFVPPENGQPQLKYSTLCTYVFGEANKLPDRFLCNVVFGATPLSIEIIEDEIRTFFLDSWMKSIKGEVESLTGTSVGPTVFPILPDATPGEGR